MRAFRIAILGIGGVGGYYGGKLAAKYAGSGFIEVAFVARGENEKSIRANGLKLITPQGEEVIHPDILTSKAEEMGAADLIICSVKGYDLEQAIQEFAPCIHETTIILPLLNGVDAPDKIRKIFPRTKVWEGCVYIISRLTSPGVVIETGTLNQLHFGSEEPDQEKLREAGNIFRGAGINAMISENISQTTWEKFLFISTLATLTSYLDLYLGNIVSNPSHRELLLNLLTEVKNVADAKGIVFSENIIKRIVDRMMSLPYDTTSSMHHDFKKGGKTELESLTGYVVKQGMELNIPTPHYDKIYMELTARTNKVSLH